MHSGQVRASAGKAGKTDQGLGQGRVRYGQEMIQILILKQICFNFSAARPRCGRQAWARRTASVAAGVAAGEGRGEKKEGGPEAGLPSFLSVGR